MGLPGVGFGNPLPDGLSFKLGLENTPIRGWVPENALTVGMVWGRVLENPLPPGVDENWELGGHAKTGADWGRFRKILRKLGQLGTGTGPDCRHSVGFRKAADWWGGLGVETASRNCVESRFPRSYTVKHPRGNTTCIILGRKHPKFEYFVWKRPSAAIFCICQSFCGSYEVVSIPGYRRPGRSVRMVKNLGVNGACLGKSVDLWGGLGLELEGITDHGVCF